MPEFLLATRMRLLAAGAMCWFISGAPLDCAAQNKAEHSDTVLYKIKQPNNSGEEAPAPDTAVVTTGSVDSTSVGVADSAATDTAAAAPPWYTLRKDGSPLFVKPRHIPKGEVRSMLREDDFWYVAVGPDKPQPVKTKEAKPLPAWVPFLIWTLLAGALVGAIVIILQSASEESWFTRTRKRRRKTLGTDDDDSAAPVDVDAALREAIDAGDYREAVHLHYLNALNALAGRGLIVPAQDKLNREYLRELSGHPLQRDFARLLTQYEFTFYGGFGLAAPAFHAIQEQYAQFQNRLNTL